MRKQELLRETQYVLFNNTNNLLIWFWATDHHWIIILLSTRIVSLQRFTHNFLVFVKKDLRELTIGKLFSGSILYPWETDVVFAILQENK